MHNSGNLLAPGTSDGGFDANGEAGVHDVGRGINPACSLSHAWLGARDMARSVTQVSDCEGEG